MSSSDSGFSTEERSPWSWPSALARTARRTIFALRVFGRAGDEHDAVGPEGLAELRGRALGHLGGELLRGLEAR